MNEQNKHSSPLQSKIKSLFVPSISAFILIAVFLSQAVNPYPSLLDDGDTGFFGPQLPVVNDDPVGFAIFIGVLKRNTVDRVDYRDAPGSGSKQRQGQQTHQQQTAGIPGYQGKRITGVAEKAVLLREGLRALVER